jgi:hypothetical protein
MNFYDVTKRLQQQAEKAAAAARNFKGLDALAAQDDYIHSDSLNVKNRRHDGESSSQPMRSLLAQLGQTVPTRDDTAEIGTAVSQIRTLDDRLSDQRATTQLMAAADGRSLSSHQISDRTRPRRPQVYDDDESDEDDPILQVTKQHCTATAF